MTRMSDQAEEIRQNYEDLKAAAWREHVEHGPHVTTGVVRKSSLLAYLREDEERKKLATAFLRQMWEEDKKEEWRRGAWCTTVQGDKVPGFTRAREGEDEKRILLSRTMED